MGIHSRGTPGYTQSRSAWVYTVEVRLGIHSRGTPGVYGLADRVGLHSLGTPGYTVEERQ